MLKPWTLVITLHAIVAVTAIVLGTFNAVRMVRGDRLHKAVGRTWAGLMLFISITGLFIGDYKSGIGIFLHGLAIWTIISISLGIYFARRGNIKSHKGFMLGSYFGLLGALIGVISVPTRRVPSYFHAYPLAMTVITIAVIAGSGFVIAGFSTAARRHVNHI
ncbi:MAG: hypothetical protein JWM81_460 [Candidatus Saccharibacteria bacterium]|nr:hypothetical protein [Candidatus Saccharibacteria bacterium]